MSKICPNCKHVHDTNEHLTIKRGIFSLEDKHICHKCGHTWKEGFKKIP